MGTRAAMQGVFLFAERIFSMKTLKFMIKRLLYGVLVLFGLSLIIFALTRIIPGNPARLALGTSATQEAVDALTEKMHLNDPFFTQYWYWLTGAFRGDLGMSLLTKRPVMTDIAEFLPTTIELTFIGIIFSVIFSVCLGIGCAVFAGKWPDHVMSVLSCLGVAIPGFVTAILLLHFFGNVWKVIPVIGILDYGFSTPARVTGFTVIDCLLGGDCAAAWNAFCHLLVPAIAISAEKMFSQVRIIRSTMLENKGKEYITFTAGYGMPSRIVIGKYLLKPSLISSVSVIGMNIASMLGGTCIIERIFSVSGLGMYGASAILNKDLNAIVGVVLVYGVITVVVNLIVDLIVSLLDPRIRLSE